MNAGTCHDAADRRRRSQGSAGLSEPAASADPVLFAEAGAARCAAAETRGPLLAGFLPNRLFKWVSEYLRYRFAPRQPFPTYSATGSDNGVYELQGDGGEIRIALAGDWASGTD